METLIWMGFLAAAGFLALFWTAQALYRKFIDPQTPRGVNSRGQHIFAGIVAGVFTYMVLALIVNQLPVGIVTGYALRLTALVMGVWAGVRVYRLLQRRWVREEVESSCERRN